MQWIGGPSKDLGEKEGAGKFAAVGSTGSSRLEGAASQGALRQANRGGGNGGGGEGGGSGETTDDKLDTIINKLDGGSGNKVEQNRAVSENRSQ